MKVVEKIKQLREALAQEKSAGRRIGFVPTMGALHEGHLSLVKQCRTENGVCVASIFVNPTQFNDRRDLETYPRTPDRDCALLEQAGCDYVFMPAEKEIYPEPDRRVFHLGAVAEVMEGAFRPGHFNGVAQIVSRLFDAVEPDCAYFGEKDFQQVAVVREMARQLGLTVQIKACPTLREPDGLAMSSRNMRLTFEQRQFAPQIAATLKESRTFAAGKRVEEVKERVVNTLNRTPCLRVEYFEIVDGASLQPLQRWEDSQDAVGCIAVFCGEVRLIDNVKYNSGN